ncbi:MAG: hypothetical protein QOJ16_195 [Acidobacteriota bacterium]|jgi:hypothetical protein|nr:hypothetical protein [Acidobacteriota bacterium]
MKKMERIDDKLFRPLATAEAKLVFAGGTQTAVTLVETSNPAPDTARDGDHE